MKPIWPFILILLSFIPLAQAQSVEFILDGYGCNGFVGRMSKTSEAVYIFTAGHCISGLLEEKSFNKKILNLSFAHAERFLVYSDKEIGSSIGISSDEIVFASFQNIDLAVLSVKQSASELIKQGIQPSIIGAEPSKNLSITLRNVLTKESVSCFVETGPLHLRYKFWDWNQVFRLSPECHLKEGWSGAGVFNGDSDVIGVLSGGNETGTCADDYCEIDKGRGLVARNGRSYLMPLAFLKNCTDGGGIIHPENCRL